MGKRGKKLDGMTLTCFYCAVTGGARGLGLTIAAAVIESGADVYCCDILESPSQPEWKLLQAKADKYGCTVEYYRVNIIDVPGVASCFDRIARESRRPITGFVGCAATMDEQMAIDYDMDAFSRVMRINVDGMMVTAQAAARLMRDSGKGGSIVMMASISGSIANRVSFSA
jgi:NAD(P)-dependent dehydrogenase (short-subunit alcohol dehydrogenase family)